jgi:hypothetical protein
MSKILINLAVLISLISYWITDQKEIEIELLYNINQDVESAPLLGQIVDAEFDSNENLYLLDGDRMKIHMYDSEGIFQNSFGREGRGPGEFTGLGGGLFFDENQNQICTIDYRGARIVCYSIEDKSQHYTINLQSTTTVRTNGLILFRSKKLLLGSHQNVNSFIHQISSDGITNYSFGDFINFESFIHNNSGKLQLSQVVASKYNGYLLVSSVAPNINKVFDDSLNLIYEHQDNLLPKPWETHMIMEPNRYRSSFYSMAVANQILSKEEYLYTWSEVVDEEIPEVIFHLELRKLENGEVISEKKIGKNYILGMQRLTDSSALLLLRNNKQNYEVHKVSIN